MRILTQTVGNSTIALLAVVVILAGSFAYYYSATTNQNTALSDKATTLNEAGVTVCQAVNAIRRAIIHTIVNVTSTLRAQIQNDRSLIAILDSTKPSGYLNMTAMLYSQIAQDQSMIDLIQGPQQVTSPPPPDPCSAFGVNIA